jgi:hypothetical protein
MTRYTHIVVHRILVEQNGKAKETDELTYAMDINHAYAIAHQLMAAGKVGVAILEMKEPTTIEDTPNE